MQEGSASQRCMYAVLLLRSVTMTGTPIQLCRLIVSRTRRVLLRTLGRAADGTKRISDIPMSCCLCPRGDAMRVTRMEARPSQKIT